VWTNNLCGAMWHDRTLETKSARGEDIMDKKIVLRFPNRLLVVALMLAVGISAAGVRLLARRQAAAPPVAVAREKDYSKAEEHARVVAKEWLARGIPGLSVAVAVDGQIAYSEGFGYADLEQRVPALAGHLAGIRHYKDDEFTISKHYEKVADGLKIFADDPLVSPPGKEFHYSS
jgi:Beta-lactamase